MIHSQVPLYKCFISKKNDYINDDLSTKASISNPDTGVYVFNNNLVVQYGEVQLPNRVTNIYFPVPIKDGLILAMDNKDLGADRFNLYRLLLDDPVSSSTTTFEDVKIYSGAPTHSDTYSTDISTYKNIHEWQFVRNWDSPPLNPQPIYFYPETDTFNRKVPSRDIGKIMKARIRYPKISRALIYNGDYDAETGDINNFNSQYLDVYPDINEASDTARWIVIGKKFIVDDRIRKIIYTPPAGYDYSYNGAWKDQPGCPITVSIMDNYYWNTQFRLATDEEYDILPD